MESSLRVSRKFNLNFDLKVCTFEDGLIISKYYLQGQAVEFIDFEGDVMSFEAFDSVAKCACPYAGRWADSAGRRVRSVPR